MKITLMIEHDDGSADKLETLVSDTESQQPSMVEARIDAAVGVFKRVLSNHGLIPARDAFLRTLREGGAL